MQESNNEKNDCPSFETAIDQLSVVDRIQLLLDNELGRAERIELFEQLDQSTDGWKKCAIAFCNEQFLKQEFESLDQSPSSFEENKQSIRKSMTATRAAPRNFVASIAIALLLGLGIGVYFGPRSVSDFEEDFAVADQVSIQTMVQEAREIVNEDRATNSIPLDLPITRLFEVENNGRRAVYVSPDPLPEFILQSMVFAGHEVEVTQEHIETSITTSRSISIPIYELRITKNQQHVQVAQTH